MKKIFISYSRKNQDVVDSLADDLVQLGHNVWLDKKVKAGHEWWDEILKKIRDCDVFIFALSEETENSTACDLELNYAFDLGKPIVPVGVTENVPINLFSTILQKKQFVDYHKQNKIVLFLRCSYYLFHQLVNLHLNKLWHITETERCVYILV